MRRKSQQLTVGSRSSTGSDFQTNGPSTEKARDTAEQSDVAGWLNVDVMHTLGFCLTGPFFSKITPKFGCSPKVNFWELLWQNFYEPDALSVTQTPALKH